MAAIFGRKRGIFTTRTFCLSTNRVLCTWPLAPFPKHIIIRMHNSNENYSLQWWTTSLRDVSLNAKIYRRNIFIYQWGDRFSESRATGNFKKYSFVTCVVGCGRHYGGMEKSIRSSGIPRRVILLLESFKRRFQLSFSCVFVNIHVYRIYVNPSVRKTLPGLFLLIFRHDRRVVLNGGRTWSLVNSFTIWVRLFGC
jgi:hypothetical protein